MPAIAIAGMRSALDLHILHILCIFDDSFNWKGDGDHRNEVEKASLIEATLIDIP